MLRREVIILLVPDDHLAGTVRAHYTPDGFGSLLGKDAIVGQLLHEGWEPLSGQAGRAAVVLTLSRKYQPEPDVAGVSDAWGTGRLL